MSRATDRGQIEALKRWQRALRKAGCPNPRAQAEIRSHAPGDWTAGCIVAGLFFNVLGEGATVNEAVTNGIEKLQIAGWF